MKHDKTTKRRKTLIAFLILVAFLFTSTTYAYWAVSVEGTEENAVGAITIGYATSVQTEFKLSNELDSGGYLVPKAQVENAGIGAVDAIHLAYDIAWVESGDSTQLDGTESVGSISINHGIRIIQDGYPLDDEAYQEIYQLIHVHYDATNPEALVLDDLAKTFRFSVTMDEPKNQRAYELIANAEISIVFNFRIYDNFITTTDESILGPSMNLYGEDIIYVELGDTFDDPGAYAVDSAGNEFDQPWRSGFINTWEVGTYIQTYGAYLSEDQMIVTTTRTVIVVDTTPPVITINGDEVVYVMQGSNYHDLGAWATDNSGDYIFVTTTGVDEIDTSVSGTYVVTYTAIDGEGNQQNATRTVIVSK